VAFADFDINAVTGFVLIDGKPAPGGFELNISDESSDAWVTTRVDGPYLPPIVRGQGRFDTSDVPAFNTGDIIIIRPLEQGYEGSAVTLLDGGTTRLNLSLTTRWEQLEDEDIDDAVSRLEEENSLLRERNRQLEEMLQESDVDPFDYEMFSASLDIQNASFASLDWITAVYKVAVERANWVLDYSTSNLGDTSKIVFQEASNTSVSIFTQTGEMIDTLLDIVPTLIDARLFTLIIGILFVGCFVVFTVIRRDSERWRREFAAQHSHEESKPPFWDRSME
jgi:hypothetical protein